MKKIRVLFIINALCLLLFCYELVVTYGVFESEAKGDVIKNLALWNIRINDTDVTTSNTFDIGKINWNSSQRVVNGKTAPGIGGYFDIVINPEDTEVAVRYDITFDFSVLNNSEFSLDTISDINGNDLVRTDEFTYSGIFTVDDINNNYVSDVKVLMLWNSVEDNNSIDYELGSIPNNDISIPVSVAITQYTGEELVLFTQEVVEE